MFKYLEDMRKKCLIKVIALLVLCYAMFGCGKPKLGSIYGTVTDYATGDPVGNANVRLNPRGETTLTGSDGTFQFNDLVDGNYSLSLSKNGYADLDDDYVIMIEKGNSVRRDVQLYHRYTAFIITVNGVETDVFDFGVYQDRIAASIINTGTTTFYLNNDYVTVSEYWIRADVDYYSQSGTGSLTISIDRSWLLPGENIGYVYINTAGISKTLTIKATKL